MSVQNDREASFSQAEDTWRDHGSEFVLIAEGKPPPGIELARERLLICRLYLGLMRTITDDYGAEFAARSDSWPTEPSASTTNAPMQTILCSGCLGKPGPIASRTSASAALGRSSILAAAARSGMVSKSHAMIDCSGIRSN